MKFGFELRCEGNSEARDRGSSGGVQFVPQFAALPGTSGSGRGSATFLLGVTTQISDQCPGVLRRGLCTGQLAFDQPIDHQSGRPLGDRAASTLHRQQPELVRFEEVKSGQRRTRRGDRFRTERW